MTVFSLYLPGIELSLPELLSARLDGEVFEIGDAFLAADAPESPALRAASLSGLLGTSLAATHLTAAWVHGVLDDLPAHRHVQRAVARRIHWVPSPRIRYRDGAVPRDDVELLGGCLVTKGRRTLVDLARVGDAEHERAGRTMAAQCPHLVPEAVEWLASRPIPHKRRAIAALERWSVSPT